MTTSTLITGVTGQDGGYLAELLVGEGQQVHGTVQPGEQAPDHLRALGDSLVIHEMDLRDGPQVSRVVQDAAPDWVVNLAGLSSVAASWEQPVLTAEVNGVGVACLLELLWQQQERTGRPVRFLQASSAEIFAGATTSPQDESTPLAPASPYGAAKAFAHHLVRVYRGRGLHAANVVLYNHESPRRPTTFVTRKITSGVAAIARGDAQELVLGTLEARRDWGWAPDYVDGMLRALRHDEPLDVVLATGVAHSVKDFVTAAFARVGIADWARYVRSDAAFGRPVDAVELVGDPTRARELLGWVPTVAFAELVGRMVDADVRPPAGDLSSVP